MKKKPKPRISQEFLRWHRDVVDYAFGAVTAAGHPLDRVTKNVIMRRVQRLEAFVNRYEGENGFPYQKVPFLADDAAALVLWPRWRAYRLAHRLFGGLKNEIIDLNVDMFNMDWLNFELAV